MEKVTKKDIFNTLKDVNVTSLISKKNNLDYLPWANAWALIMEHFPNSDYKIKEFPEYMLNKQTGMWQATGRDVDYRKTPAGVEVEVELIIEGNSFIQKLYVMDNRMRVVQEPTYVQINKTQMRCLVKAAAMAGLGLNLYQGEDLPTGDLLQKNGLTKEQEMHNAELKRNKAAFMQMLSMIAQRQKTSVKELGGEVEQEVSKTYGDDLSQLDKYKNGIEVLKGMVKKCTEN